MQADSEKLRQAWIKAVQNSIATAFRDKGDDGEVKKQAGKLSGQMKEAKKNLFEYLNQIKFLSLPCLCVSCLCVSGCMTHTVGVYSPSLSHQKLDRKSSTSTGSLDSSGETKERSLKGESALQKVLAIPGNACCCDCGQPDPRWASINLGITLCIQCSGIHR